MSLYPTFEQYDEALQSPGLVLLDPELKTGVVKRNGLGLPLALCGGFALTYTLSCGNKKYALRCFHKKSNALEPRYNAITKKLRALSSDYFLDFEFQPKGMRVNNDYFPVVKMAWGEGEELGVFIENNFHQKKAIQNLRKSFLTLSAFLRSSEIAHGDIQTGNVMINDSGLQLQLLDYDGMFVDEIKDLGNSECGHKNFQHPKRSSQFDRSLDRFSLISIYLALQALEVDKSLWVKSQPDGESIVFKANDYAMPAGSAIFSTLFSKPALKKPVQNFAAVCESPYESVPSLDDFIRGKNIPRKVISIFSKPTEEAAQAYISPYPVLDAGNYSLCLQHVGDRVELIGRVFAIKEGKTKFGKPYLFVNFDDWKKESLKITIWSDVLEKLKMRPLRSWVGKWVRVVGLMDPPYTGTAGRDKDKRSYTNLSITLAESSQLYLIDEKEARYRLNSSGERKPSTAKPPVPSVNNSEVLLQMEPGGPGLAGTGRGASITDNKVILLQMQRRASKSTTPSSGTNQYPQQVVAPRKKENSRKFLPPVVIIVLITAVILLLLHFFR
jgi:serine/threonine protein kinase